MRIPYRIRIRYGYARDTARTRIHAVSAYPSLVGPETHIGNVSAHTWIRPSPTTSSQLLLTYPSADRRPRPLPALPVASLTRPPPARGVPTRRPPATGLHPRRRPSSDLAGDEEPPRRWREAPHPASRLQQQVPRWPRAPASLVGDQPPPSPSTRSPASGLQQQVPRRRRRAAPSRLLRHAHDPLRRRIVDCNLALLVPPAYVSSSPSPIQFRSELVRPALLILSNVHRPVWHLQI